jgi:hypothetical protein
MNVSEARKRYGDEYPNAVVINGIRLPLTTERRFSRFYYSQSHKRGTMLSRFMEGSATMTSPQLQEEWPRWTENERADFCRNFGWLKGQSGFPEMVRFIMEHGSPDEWSIVALKAASALSVSEAFERLLRALRTTEVSRSTNLVQAIAATSHPNATRVLRDHLDTVWIQPKLWEDDSFVNWLAFCATKCIRYLVDLGASPNQFEERVRELSQHPCSRNREACQIWLGKHYEWLEG